MAILGQSAKLNIRQSVFCCLIAKLNVRQMYHLYGICILNIIHADTCIEGDLSLLCSVAIVQYELEC